MATIFTSEELMSLKKDSLKRLAKYYNIDSKNMKKADLVEALMKVLIGEKVEGEEPMPVMSERVRRIKESLENG
jgi:hypothetical protein